MPKNIPTIWRFLLPVLILLALAPFVLILQQTAQQLDNIQQDAQEQARTLTRLLLITDELVGEQANSAMRLLKERGIALGEPSINGTVDIAGKTFPNLLLGETQLTNLFKFVDDFSSIVGGTATLFVRSENDFVRVTTNVQRSDGGRAIGTLLNPSGKAITALRAGLSFHGVVDILGEPYITRYDPMYDNLGNVIGAYYVGYKVDMQALRNAVQSTKQLKTGFAVVLDDHRKIRFISSHIAREKAEQLIQTHPSDWAFVNESIPSWGFNVMIIYPLSEARAAGLSNSLFVIVAGTLLGALLIAIILWQLRRLILNPIGGDPALAIDIMQRIASGDLMISKHDRDAIKAQPDTLMANVLSMRQKLFETVAILRKNADRMSLSASVFDHAHDGIFITDAAMRIVEVNPAFSIISGYARESALGKTPQELGFAMHEADFFPQFLQDTQQTTAQKTNMQSTEEWRGETWNLHQNSEPYAAWLSMFTVRNEAKNISHYVGLFSDITQAKEQKQNLEYMAYHDPLTQLPNRTLLADRLQQALAHADRSEDLLAICYFDLDGFKPVNDTLGHEAGDRLLVQLSARIRTCLRESDTIARLGGDEFAMLLCGLKNTNECEQTLERLLEVIKAPYQIADQSVSVSASIGYTLFPFDNSEPDTLLRHADYAMYQAKVNGGSRYHLFDTEHDQQFRGLRQEREVIEKAMENGEFRLFYQPKVNMRLGQVVGVEALIRWQHPTLGLRSPAEFLPVIENTDFAVPLGEWVILEALHQMEMWQTEGLSLQVSVNIAARHMMQADFFTRLASLLRHFPSVSPVQLELEITETAVIENIASVAHTINSCKSLGVTFALDDFGVGYSSLTHLRRLPVDVIKVDQSFVRDMLVDADDLAVVLGVISLSRDFDRKVVAEGVETAEHGLHLLKMGCNVAQGYGIARPMPASEVSAWVLAYKPHESWR